MQHAPATTRTRAQSQMPYARTLGLRRATQAQHALLRQSRPSAHCTPRNECMAREHTPRARRRETHNLYATSRCDWDNKCASMTTTTLPARRCSAPESSATPPSAAPSASAPACASSSCASETVTDASAASGTPAGNASPPAAAASTSNACLASERFVSLRAGDAKTLSPTRGHQYYQATHLINLRSSIATTSVSCATMCRSSGIELDSASSHFVDTSVVHGIFLS
jgi:hypothetical protein